MQIKWRTTGVGVVFLITGLAIVISSRVIARKVALKNNNDPLYRYYNLIGMTDKRPWLVVLLIACFGCLTIAVGVLGCIIGFMGEGE
jgi:hypothetical protein